MEETKQLLKVPGERSREEEVCTVKKESKYFEVEGGWQIHMKIKSKESETSEH